MCIKQCEVAETISVSQEEKLQAYNMAVSPRYMVKGVYTATHVNAM